MTIKKLTLLSLMAATVIGAGSAQAETVTEYITKQSELETLDFTIERYDRLIKLKEAQIELENVGVEKESDSNAGNPQMGGQAQYFVPGMPGGNQVEGKRLTAEEQAKKDREEALNREMAIAQNAKLVEVFRMNTPGDSYGAVLEVNGGLTEASTGDMISHWKVSRISLSEIVLENQRYPGAVRVIKQIR